MEELGIRLECDCDEADEKIETLVYTKKHYERMYEKELLHKGKVPCDVISELHRINEIIRNSSRAAKKNPYPGTSKPSSVAVLGAGLMGAGIAQVSAEKGLAVALKDVSPEGLAKGVAYVAGNLDKKVKRRRMDAFKRNTIVSSITGYHDSEGGNSDAFAKKAQDLDVVIEVPIYCVETKFQAPHAMLSP